MSLQTDKIQIIPQKGDINFHISFLWRAPHVYARYISWQNTKIPVDIRRADDYYIHIIIHKN